MNVLEQNLFVQLYGGGESRRIFPSRLRADAVRIRSDESTERRPELLLSFLPGRRRVHRTSSDDGFSNAKTLMDFFYSKKKQVLFPISDPSRMALQVSARGKRIHGSHPRSRRIKISQERQPVATVGSFARTAMIAPFQKSYHFDSWVDLAWHVSPGTADSTDPIHPSGSVKSPIRPAGPVQFILKLLDTWGLGSERAAVLLGLEDREHAQRILDGSAPLVGRDVKDRIVVLYHIRRTLWSLFQDDEVENEWLRESHLLIYEKTPMNLLLEGSMESLLMLREYVDSIARR